jgi:hypothetical protein
MYISQTLHDFDNDYVFLCEQIKNNIMDDGVFTRILYTLPEYTMNGINLVFSLKDTTVDKYYNKFKCNFNPAQNVEVIERILEVEENILNKYKISKRPLFKIYEQVKYGNIKLFSDNNYKTDLFMLKISGIWENSNDYGLTYKFVKIQQEI